MAGQYIIPLVSLATAVLGAAVPDVSLTLQNILANTHGSPGYHYPTDLTRGIFPKPFHSHNDYWRDVPFYSALSYGAVSVEADVWLVNGTLYIGHETSALTEDRTFDSLYVQPILDTLRRQNPVTRFAPSPTFHGVYDTSSDQTLYLFVDLKTSGAAAWPVVLKAIEPLRAAGYLTTYNGSALTLRPVTVVGTGSTTLDLVRGVPGSPDAPRYAFLDAPLEALGDDVTEFDAPVASTEFGEQFGQVKGLGEALLNNTALEKLRGQVAAAHEKGIMARYYGLPAFPIATRNAVWRLLFDEGIDLLNVDDLKGASGFWEARG